MTFLIRDIAIQPDAERYSESTAVVLKKKNKSGRYVEVTRLSREEAITLASEILGMAIQLGQSIPGSSPSSQPNTKESS